MRNIPVDTTKIRALVVGEPTAQMKDGAAVLDRVTGQPNWNIPVTVIGDFRAETIQLGIPEGGFPKGLGIGAFVIPDGMVAILWERKDGGGFGVMMRAKSVKVEGGSAGLKGVAS
jgi:hypothetical protein